MSGVRVWSFVACAAMSMVHRATAQRSGATDCDFVGKNGFNFSQVGGQTVQSAGGGITVTCRSRKITLIADSGQRTGESLTELYGHVHYSEPTRIELHSDQLTYYQLEERVVAKGNVVAVVPSGSTLTGPEATYLRVIPGRRPFEDLTAVRGANVVIAAKGDSGKPVNVNAQTIRMRGDSLIYASKNAVITRSDLIAKGDSIFLDGRTGNEMIRLMFSPSVEGLQGRKFRLEGEVIDAFSAKKKLQRVLARGRGHATSQDLDIVADTIDLRMSNDALERAIAWNRSGQARAKSPSETITADSIDVVMPKQKVSVVYAVHRAYAQADPDTARFHTTDKDWLRGDLLTAWFDTVVSATKDTSSTPPIRRILASHRGDSAQAYYHLAATDTSLHAPAIGYVRGRTIQIDFDHRKVALVSVKDSVAGLYLEPRRDTVSVKSAAKPGSRPPPTKKPPRTPEFAPRKPKPERT